MPTAEPLFGREDELNHARAVLSRVEEGAGQCLWLAGALGVGKTSFAQEILRDARERNFTVLEGRAWPLDSGLAFAPVLEALGRGLRRVEPLRRQGLIEGLPDLKRLFSWLELPHPRIADDPALTQTRLFEAITRCLERFTHSRPVLLFIDDLHAADNDTLSFLHYLLREVHHLPLLALLTYRDATPTLKLLSTYLERAQRASTLVLEPLSPRAVKTCAAQHLGTSISNALLDLLVTRTGGIPLFLHAILRHLQAQDGLLLDIDGTCYPTPRSERALPPDVRVLIEASISELSSDQRCVAELLAVDGAALPYDILREAVDLEDAGLIDTLSSLQRWVTEVPGASVVSYHLAHPLVQETLYLSLSEVVRRRLHQTLLEVFERQADVELARLARHAQGSGTADAKMLDILWKASRDARHRCGHREAVMWLSSAVGIARGGVEPERLPTLLEELGDALSISGELSAAVEIWDEALSHDARGAERRDLQCRAALALWDLGRTDACDARLREARAQLEPNTTFEACSRVYLTTLTVCARNGDVQGVTEIANKLTQIAPGARFETLMAAFHVHEVRIDFAAALSALERAERVATKPADRLRVSLARAGGALFIGRHADTLLFIEAFEALVEELGDTTRRSTISLLRAALAEQSGQFDEAITHCRSALASGHRTGQARWHVSAYAIRAMTLARLGELERAEEALEEAELLFNAFNRDHHQRPLLITAQILVALETEDMDQALRAAEFLPDKSIYITSTATKAELLARLRRGDEALALCDILDDLSEIELAHACAARVRGLVHRSQDEQHPAYAAFTRALDGFQALGFRFEAARVRWERAALCIAPEESTKDAALALERFEAMGAQRYALRARALLKKLGVRPRKPRRARSKGLLSERELEVARLAGSGLTNAQMAKQLFLSPHTIATHIKHIYGRVGVSSRAALGQWLAENKLT